MASLDQWDAYIDDLGDKLGNLTGPAAGWEREKLGAQLEDAAAGRANAYKIAQLSASTQRYGIDQATMVQLKRLKEEARQFDQTHALELDKFSFTKESWGKEFGLKYAQTATEYLSTPDRYFQGADFRAMADRALTGAYGGGETPQGPQPYGAQGAPTPKTEADFGVLAGYGQAPAAGAPAASSAWAPGRTGVASPFLPSPGAPAPATPADAVPGDQRVGTNPVQDANGDGAPDPRVKVLSTMMKELPPSTTPGYDDNDAAVLRAAQALYATNLQPGTLERMRPGQKAIFGSAGRRLGYDMDDYLEDYKRNAPGQRSVRAA